MSVLYVTSFSPDLYKATGHLLVESFLANYPLDSNDKLLCCTEGMQIECLGEPYLEGFEPPAHSLLRLESLDSDCFLHGWLRDFANIIPDYLGGTAKECTCPERHKRHGKHKPKCHWQWMNRNASRWFRKVVSLQLAAHRAQHKGQFQDIVWLDSDTRFVARVPQQFLNDHLDKAAMFYFRGHRPAIESGIIGFRPANGGAEIIRRLGERYTSGRFRDDERWDDGFQLTQLVDLNKDIRVKDLVHPTKWNRRTNHVIPTTNIAKYLVHDKGAHGDKMGIMK